MTVLKTAARETRAVSEGCYNGNKKSALKQAIAKLMKRHLAFTVFFLQATRGSGNPNLQVVITHVWHVYSQHSFGLPVRMNGMHRAQFDHARLDLLSLVI